MTRITSKPIISALSDTGKIFVNDDQDVKQISKHDLMGQIANASAIYYDGSGSGITASNVQGAITEVKGKVDTLGSPVTYKGSVATFSALPASPKVGDMYNVVDDETTHKQNLNYAWDGKEWDSLGSTIDMSLYYTKLEINGFLDLKANAADVYTKSEVDTKVNNLGSPVTYKGTVSTYADLPTLHAVGDMYNVTADETTHTANMNYCWNGTAWDSLGATTDMNLYYTKTQTDTAISNTVNAQNTINGKLAGNFASVYSPSSTYALGDYCTYQNVLYKCTTAITTPEAWNSAHWIATRSMDKLIDTGWQLCNVDTSVFTNLTWEPLAYRRIGDVVYVHGGGKILSINTITTLPKPRQNSMFVCSNNATSHSYCNILLDNSGILKKAGTDSTQEDVVFCFSYITRE